MARPVGSKNRPKILYQCEECGETGFATRKCPECGNTNTLELNKGGIPITDVQAAIAQPPQVPILLGAAPDVMDPTSAMREFSNNEHAITIAEMSLDRVKSKAAKEKAERILAEEELAHIEQRAKEPHHVEDLEDPMMPKQQKQRGVDPSVLLNGIGKWSDEAREDLFDRLSNDDSFAVNWGLAFNAPGQPQMPMNAQQMMDQQMWNMMQMNQQPQTPAEPKESAASMMTAMIAAMAQLQELSGGKQDNTGLERIMDRIDRMDERHTEQTAAMQKEMLELRAAQSQTQVTRDDVQRLTQEAVSNAAQEGTGFMSGLENITSVVSGLEELGLVKRNNERGEHQDNFEQMKWQDQMALKREDRDREDTKEARDANIQLSKNQATTDMFSMMLEMSRDAKEKQSEETKKGDKPFAPLVSRSVVS